MTSPEVPFFRSYNRTIAVSYTALLLALAVFFAFQLRLDLRAELRLIEGQVARHGQLLEFVLRNAADQVEALRMSAGWTTELSGAARRQCAPAAELARRGELRTSRSGFHRDAAADRDAGGNLVGRGSLAGRSADFYCDLEAAQALHPQLRALPFRLPNAARVRFISAQHFQLVSPWQPAETLPALSQVYGEAVWRLGQPAANPDRRSYWAPPFFAGEAAGLLVPVAAPVYDGERFMGVVAIDTSLDYLNRINGGFAYPQGTMAVVDGQGRALAHPGVFADPLAVREPGTPVQALPPPLRQHADPLVALAALPADEASHIDGWVVVRHPFRAAPWQLVYAVPLAELRWKLLLERGSAMAAMLLALALLMGLTYALTTRDFVRPAAKLVMHLVHESSFRPQPLPRVPAAWRPWFEAITQAFRESLQLSALRQELDIAARMQQSILPRQWPQDARFQLRGTTIPAREVGGDFYDHFPLGQGRHALVVADVSGKGIGAGLFAMVSKTLLRTLATQGGRPLGDVAAQVNEALCQDNDDAMFVTAFFGAYDPASGRLAYANAGHPPPLLVRAEGGFAWLAGTRGTAFGVVEGLAFAETTVELAPGDLLLIYSDGVTEAQDAQGRAFGSERLAALFEQPSACGPEEAIARVRQALRDFVGMGEPFDDVTCMVLLRQPDSQTG